VYKKVKQELKRSGEVMIKMSDGAVFELHLHNTTFEDDGSIMSIIE